MKIKKLLFTFALVVLGVTTLSLAAPKAHALSGSDFNPGRIIDDSVFFNKDAMSVNDIQNFIYSKSGNCDTWHAAGSGAQGATPPWTCLYQYRENTTTHENNIGNPSANPAGSITGAQIIYNAAQQYNISPKVLLVLIQKESSLITDNWPYPWQYRSATGYGCPDTAPCDSQYYGFYNQVNKAAFQYRRYATYPNEYNFKAGRNNNVGYNPNGACGYQTVYIQNQATAGLYNYTPYVPNAAALNNLYGTGDGCSAYGNRNFWRLYSDWFGSTTAPNYAWQYVGQTNSVGGNMVATQKATWTVSAKNIGTATWSNTGSNPVRLGASHNNDRTSQFCNCSRAATLNESSVAPGAVGTFTFNVQAPTNAGTYNEYFNLLAEGAVWMNDPGLYFGINVTAANYSFTTISNTLPSNMSASGTGSGVITLRNDSNVAWYNDGRYPLDLGTSGPLDRSSVFATTGWLGSSRPARMGENTVAPGQNATFTIPLKAPAAAGTYNENFSPVAEGYKWFGQSVSKSIAVGAQVQAQFTLVTNQSITTNQYLVSQDGRYRLVMQSDGNLVLYSPNRPIWSTGTSGRPANRFIVQDDGNMVLYGPSNYYWASGTNGRGGTVLVVQDDGNLVLYNPQGRPIWSTGTSGRI